MEDIRTVADALFPEITEPVNDNNNNNEYIAALKRYELRARDRFGRQYSLCSASFVLQEGTTVILMPRFYSVTFNICTWAIEYSRNEVVQLCKSAGVSGSVTRNFVNSIEVTLQHPNKEVVTQLYDRLSDIVTKKRGFIDHENTTDTWEYGTLTPRISNHRGTARRNDGVRSWEDDDAGSGSTYFNAPIAPIKRRINTSSRTLSTDSLVNLPPVHLYPIAAPPPQVIGAPAVQQIPLQGNNNNNNNFNAASQQIPLQANNNNSNSNAAGLVPGTWKRRRK